MFEKKGTSKISYAKASVTGDSCAIKAAVRVADPFKNNQKIIGCVNKPFILNLPEILTR